MGASSCASVIGVSGIGGLFLILAIAVAVKLLSKRTAKK